MMKRVRKRSSRFTDNTENRVIYKQACEHILSKSVEFDLFHSSLHTDLRSFECFVCAISVEIEDTVQKVLCLGLPDSLIHVVSRVL